MSERLLVSDLYKLSSLSVFGLLDNGGSVACVLRSLADLCSVLPLYSGLAAFKSPKHPFLTTPSPCSPHFSYFHCLFIKNPPSVPLLFLILGTVRKTTNSIYLHSTHIFDLNNLVMLNKEPALQSGKLRDSGTCPRPQGHVQLYQGDKHKLVAIEKRRVRKKRWLVLVEQDVENELLAQPPPKGNFVFLLIQGYSH